MASPDTRERFKTGGWREIAMSPEDTEAFIRSEAEKWPKFLRQAGIRVD
jgi:tripartite-type tricarboxylate transporter receptor subunit TctC